MKSNSTGGFFVSSLFALALAGSIPAQTTSPTPVFHWSTLAGRASVGLEDGPATDARFNQPHGLAQDLAGNLYVADTGNHTIRKISPAGVVSTLAGLAEQSGSADGVGSAARFNHPQGVAVDLSGNIYVADTGNHTIRKITPAGIVTTLAGQAGSSGTGDGAAASARFDAPDRLTVDPAGNVYLSNNGVRKISNGQVKTLTIPSQTTDPDGATLTLKTERCPAVDVDGTLYFASDHPSELVKIDSTGKVSVVRDSFFGTDPSQSTYAYHYRDDTLFNDASGNLFLVVEVQSLAIIRGYLGVSMQPDGTLDQQHIASFASPIGHPIMPLGVAVDRAGKWYFTRSDDHAVLNPLSKTPFGASSPISPGTPYAGTPQLALGPDGESASARLSMLTELTTDSSGNAWVAETSIQYPFDTVQLTFVASTRLRKISPAGTVTTPAQPWFPLASNTWDREQYPTGLTSDTAGNIYLSKRKGFDYVFELFKITPNGAGSPFGPALNGYGYLYDPVIDSSGTLSLLDAFSTPTYQYYYQILQPQPDGRWLILAGGPSREIKDGTGSDARFNYPHDVTADRHGNLFLIDTIPASPDPLTGDAYIRKVSATGVVSTVSNKLTSHPSGLAIDSNGTFYLTHTDSHLITMIDASGVELPIGGKAGVSGSTDGTGDQARFASPGKIAVDTRDNLYVLDGFGTTIRTTKLTSAGPAITTQPQSLTVAAGGNGQFSVTATGEPPPTYQWFLNGSTISGATGSSLSFTTVRSTDAGDYTVVVTNSAGSVTSSKATLTVSSAAVPTVPAPASTGNGSGGGGGALGVWFVISLLGTGAAREVRQKRRL